jgi:hypothetical protein
MKMAGASIKVTNTTYRTTAIDMKDETWLSDNMEIKVMPVQVYLNLHPKDFFHRDRSHAEDRQHDRNEAQQEMKRALRRPSPLVEPWYVENLCQNTGTS